MINLKKVDSKNIWKIVKLSVHENQRDFVATNTESILEAYTTIIEGGVAAPFGIYNDQELVGFVMFGYGSIEDEDEPKVADGNYCIWRFMIATEQQGHGYGRTALEEAIAYIQTEPYGKAECCWLSYESDNVVARGLYSSFGFQENGELCGDEVVAVLKL